jgi:hypothetical protein
VIEFIHTDSSTWLWFFLFLSGQPLEKIKDILAQGTKSEKKEGKEAKA